MITCFMMHQVKTARSTVPPSSITTTSSPFDADLSLSSSSNFHQVIARKENQETEVFQDSNVDFLAENTDGSSYQAFLETLTKFDSTLTTDPIPTLRSLKNHPIESIIGDPTTGILTRHGVVNECL